MAVGDFSERSAAGEALGKLGAAAVPTVTPLLHDSSADVRLTAAKALRRIGPDARAAVPGLVALLTDRDLAIRSTAIDALEAIGPGARGAIGSLEGLAQRDPTLRLAVERALRAIRVPAPRR